MQLTLLIFSKTDMAPIFARAMMSAVGAEGAAGFAPEFASWAFESSAVDTEAVTWVALPG